MFIKERKKQKYHQGNANLSGNITPKGEDIVYLKESNYLFSFYYLLKLVNLYINYWSDQSCFHVNTTSKELSIRSILIHFTGLNLS